MRDRGYYRAGGLVKRVRLTRVHCYMRDGGYYRAGGLLRRVRLTRIHCYMRDRGYCRVGGLLRRVRLTRVHCYMRDRGCSHSTSTLFCFRVSCPLFFCFSISPCVFIIYNGTRELTLKCKLKCYFKPMNNPLGVSPSKGKQGTTRGKEKIF